LETTVTVNNDEAVNPALMVRCASELSVIEAPPIVWDNFTAGSMLNVRVTGGAAGYAASREAVSEQLPAFTMLM
jgi:hypothetical protein